MLYKKFSMDDLPDNIMCDFYRYWLDMKDNRIMPSREDLKPETIVRLLPYLTLVDVEEATGRYKFRLIGTETVKSIGKDITGKYLDELPEIERFLKERFDWLAREKRPYYFFEKVKWTKKYHMDYYVLGFPLSHNDQDVNMFMFGTRYMFPDESQNSFNELII